MMRLSFLMICVLALNACGLSPQANHRYPARTPAQNSAETTAIEALRCDFDFVQAKLCAGWLWEKEPTRNNEGSFRLYFWKKNTPSSAHVDPGATVAVKLWMPDHGHGSQKVRLAPVVNTDGVILWGEFSATEVYFVMPGRWEVIVQLKDAQGEVIESAQTHYQAI